MQLVITLAFTVMLAAAVLSIARDMLASVETTAQPPAGLSTTGQSRTHAAQQATMRGRHNVRTSAFPMKSAHLPQDVTRWRAAA